MAWSWQISYTEVVLKLEYAADEGLVKELMVGPQPQIFWFNKSMWGLGIGLIPRWCQ